MGPLTTVGPLAQHIWLEPCRELGWRGGGEAASDQSETVFFLSSTSEQEGRMPCRGQKMSTYCLAGVASWLGMIPCIKRLPVLFVRAHAQVVSSILGGGQAEAAHGYSSL